MTEHEQSTPRNIPDWAEQERDGDLGWITENMADFWLAAQQGYDMQGRGVIMVDTTVSLPDAGHPFAYFALEVIEQGADEDTLRLVRSYDPGREFVAALIKDQDRISTYRLSLVTPEGDEETGQGDESGWPETIQPEPPDLETLMAWQDEEGCEATDGCWVEADGVCPHGHRSWLLELGLI